MAMTDAPNVLWFDDPRATESALVGGKGANLARLTQASFPVPGGFCVTTAAYASFVEGAGIRPELERLTREILHDDPGQLDKVTAEMRELVSGASVPEWLASAVVDAYTALGND